MTIRIAPGAGRPYAAVAGVDPFRPPQTHADREALALSGAAEYLLAEDGAEVVGRVVLHLPGSPRMSDEAKATGLPEIEDLAVRSDRRDRGTGTMLLAACCSLCSERGFGGVVLSVGVASAARRLYEREGFAAVGDPFEALDAVWTAELACTIATERRILMHKALP